LLRHHTRRLGAGALLLLAACSHESTAPGPTPARTSLPRALSASEQNVLASANAFSFALWQRLASSRTDTNLFVSPLSASFALGMAMNGAGGNTLTEMRSALRLGASGVADANAGYKALIGLLTTLDPSVKMEIANSIWPRRDFTVNPSFLDAGRTWFDATVSPLDFASPSALPTINGWVNDKTHGRIPTILDEIAPDDVMFLINAIYFKGTWRAQFDPAETRSAPFHGVGGDRSVNLMHRQGTIAMAAGDGFRAVDLPYGDSSFTMTVILPDPDRSVESVAASLDEHSWSALLGRFRNRGIDLYLPKLTLEWKRDLIPDLQALGMRDAFDPMRANFSGIASRSDLYISTVRQKTFVQIDEEGTEAAAVTSIGISVTSAPSYEPFRVDRPFIFAIRERLSGTILFMGKIVRLP
jgi:serpin B